METADRSLPRRGWLHFAMLLIGAGLFYRSLGIAGPVILAAWILAYLITPILNRFSRLGIPPLGTVVIVFVVASGAFTGLMIWLIPELLNLASELPKLRDIALQRMDQIILKIGELSGLRPTELAAFRRERLSLFAGRITEFMVETLRSFVTSGVGIIETTINLILFPIFFAFFALRMERFNRSVRDIVPPVPRRWFEKHFAGASSLVFGYIRGLLTVSACLVCIYGAGFLASGLPYGALMALVMAVLYWIPYVGFALGVLAGIVLMWVMKSPAGTWVGASITFTVGQIAETYFLTPKFVGDRLGVHPLLVLAFIIVGANLKGVSGMVVAAPIGALIWHAVMRLMYEGRSRPLDFC